MDDVLEIPGTRSGCSETTLRRLRAGELAGDEERRAREHLASCPRCEATNAQLDAQAESFRREVDFERFVGAVERRVADQRRRRWAGPVSLALAAGFTALVLAGPLQQLVSGPPRGANTLKGGTTLELYVGGAGAAPRLARDGETLAPGERVRVGYQAGSYPYVAVVSIDESGEVTALYPESGSSLATKPGTQLMPDSIELTGRGAERIVALFSKSPLEVSAATDAARRELKRAGSVADMGPLPIDAEQSTRLVRKP